MKHGDTMQSDEPMEVTRVKIDLTINVPTMIAILTLVVTTLVAGVRIYNDIDSRVTASSYEVRALRERVNSLEVTAVSIRQEQNQAMQLLRSEIRSDLTEIKRSVNLLLIPQSRNPETR